MIFVFNKKNIIMGFTLICVFLCSFVFLSIYNREITANVITNTIIIDPGHGGEDGGAIGVTGSFEKDLNLEISKKLKEKLLSSGFNVVMTRDSDVMLCDSAQTKNKKRTDLKNRVNVSRLYENGLFLSIHMNFFEDRTQKGAQVFYGKNNEDSKALADFIQEELIKNLDNNNKRKTKPAGKEIYLLNHIDIPVCLVECGFISSPTEEQLLKDEVYQWKVADSITAGILNYISR